MRMFERSRIRAYICMRNINAYGAAESQPWLASGALNSSIHGDSGPVPTKRIRTRLQAAEEARARLLESSQEIRAARAFSRALKRLRGWARVRVPVSSRPRTRA